MKKMIRFFLLVIPLLASACGDSQSSEPFRPLAKITSDPRHESAFNATEAAWQALHVTPMVEDTAVVEEVQKQAEDEVAFYSEIATETSPFDQQSEIILEQEAVSDPMMQPLAQVQQVSLYGTSADGQNTYQMQNGDTLSCLGRRFNINLDQLMQYNGVKNESSVTVGTVIILPSMCNPWSVLAGPRTLRSHPVKWQVQTGDTIFSIACAFGTVFPEDIAAANGLELNSVLSVGQQIIVP